MKPYYADEWLSIYEGDCRDVLRELPADSVDCVVTSPPYWGLRDYGVDAQIGLEATPEEYVAKMMAVFREVRRVLKPTGTVWLNLGDSYTRAQTNNVPQSKWQKVEFPEHAKAGSSDGAVGRAARPGNRAGGLKDKDLVGIPWRVAFALQADGWYLRSDIIWSKPNPMPESVTDRPTKSHEYLFLLTKSARYYFDADAVAEVSTYGPDSGQKEAAKGSFAGKWADPSDGHRNDGAFRAIRPTRNIRSVWTIATRPYPGAHFAVFPPELPERCIKAGSPAEGVVLDPFGGSGTVGMVANRLSRRAILIDLNSEYLRQQMQRNAQTPLGLDAA